MRKWLVRNFVLGTWVKIFGKTWHVLRAPKILFPLYAFVGSMIVFDKNYPVLQWYDYTGLFTLLLGLWFGFKFKTIRWGHFHYFPAKFEEFDDLQKLDYLRGKQAGVLGSETLTGNEYMTYHKLERYYNYVYSRYSFVNVFEYTGLVIAILIIVIWYNLFKYVL